MTHRQDPDRGVFTAVCDDCGTRTRCRLYPVHNRYWWMCPPCTAARDQAEHAVRGQHEVMLAYEGMLDEDERRGH